MKKNIHKSPPEGQEITCVMKLSKNTLLLNSEILKKLINDILLKERFDILDSISHDFDPHGFTVLFLLAESHLSVHTYPEYNSLYFNLYSCRGSSDAEPTFNSLLEVVKPEKIIFIKKEVIPVT